MMDSSNNTSIREIVNKCKFLGRLPETRDPDVYQLVIDGMRDLSLFTLPHKQMVKINVDSLNRIPLPKDYLMFLAVGAPKNGTLYTFTRKESIVQTSNQTYHYEAVDTKYGEGAEVPVMSFYSYGTEGGINETYFAINERRKFIQLTGFSGTQATLHYVSSGISESPDGVELPKICEPALIAYVMWKLVQYDTQLPIQEKQYREIQYGNEQRALNDIYSPTVDEILDRYYSTLYQTIKR